MAIDLNALPTTAEIVEVDYDNYVDQSEFPPPVPDGDYTLLTKEVVIDKFDENTKVITFLLTHEVVDDNGKTIGRVSFDRISTKVFERSGVRVSQAADQLRAFGITTRPQSAREYGELMKSQEGQTFRANLRWEARCTHKDTEFQSKFDGKLLTGGKAPFEKKGEKNFPLNGSGHNPNVTCDVCGKEVGANSKINRRIAKS